MPSPSSNRATFRPEGKDDVFPHPAELIPDEVVETQGRIGRLPPFSLNLEDDPTPAGEDEAEAWVASICNKPKQWLPRLLAASDADDLKLARAQFAKMYRIYADKDHTAHFFERYFRRPETPAGTKPFPIRIEITALLMCAGLGSLGLLLLIITR
jgi:hypothetical protein